MIVPIAIAALVLGAASKNARAAAARGRALPFSIVEALAAPWGAIWDVPPLLIEVVAQLESHFQPSIANTTDPRAVAKGGAWGMFQITLDTAKDLLGRVRAFRRYPAFKRWDGTGPSLLDPGLNTMVASWYLANLWHEFGDYPQALAAYHQGPDKVRSMLAAGKTIPDQLPPKGRAYVRDALTIKRELEQRYTS